jgi:hypothetical protein
MSPSGTISNLPSSISFFRVKQLTFLPKKHPSTGETTGQFVTPKSQAEPHVFIVPPSQRTGDQMALRLHLILQPRWHGSTQSPFFQFRWTNTNNNLVILLPPALSGNGLGSP